MSRSVIQAQAGDAHGPVSLERIRAALAEPPPRLHVPAPSIDVPTFRAEVHQSLSFVAPVDADAFDLTWGLPSVGELVGSGIGKLRSAAVGYQRRRTKRKARKEVDDALAAFCAVHECPPPTGR
ncbi:MAG: hypothetical protein ABIT71_03090 [Vicinamibacteraceae bacterium]